jgi:C4-dicarboxylate transporter DctM subunit
MESYALLTVLLLLGMLFSMVPVFLSLLLTGLIGLVFAAGIDPKVIIEVMYRSMDNFALVVVLFFILCGNIMTTGSIVRKLVDTANVLVGWLPGGLAIAGIIACGMFGAISGSTVATMVAMTFPISADQGGTTKFSIRS